MTTAQLEQLERITRSEIASRYGISETDLDELELSGVKLPEEPVKIGDGLTRIVYHGVYKRGERRMELAVKIPKPVNPEDSIIGFINTTRRDVNLREVEIHNALEGHPRIVPVLGTIETEDGRIVSFEQQKNKAVSLEEFVNDHGPMRDEERAVKFIENLIEPFLYLHGPDVRVLHRDVKPSNVLMSSGEPILTDFQNAVLDYWHFRCSAQPTRGGTRYTRYTLINRLLRGEETTYTRQDEMHSIAATILYALTGEDPFDYKLRGVAVESDYEPTDKETVIGVGGKKFLIKLSSGGKDLEEITEEENTQRVRSAISKMDGTLRKKYGSLLERCLISEHKKPVKNIETFNREFNRIKSSFWLKFKEKLIAGARYVLPTAGAVAAGLLAAGVVKYLNDLEAKRPSPPTVVEMLRQTDYLHYNLGDLDGMDKEYVYAVLVPYMERAKKLLPTVEEIRHGSRGDVAEEVRFGHDVHRLPKRLTSSWLRACYLNTHLIGKYGNEFNEKRLSPCFVPESFMIKTSTIGYRPSDAQDPGCVVAHGLMYLKLCLGPNQTVEDTLADYFSSRLDQSTSMSKTGSSTYLPRLVDTAIKPGYNKFLPPHQRELINSALALYMITDEAGEVHYDWIPTIVHKSFIGIDVPSCSVLKDIDEKRADIETAFREAKTYRR
ncbi:MAG: protein kinase [Candidatus Nanoarchaeia archaeon]|nr:protein kinase [Candidatus Nanoarchaeia archaeon]